MGTWVERENRSGLHRCGYVGSGKRPGKKKKIKYVKSISVDIFRLGGG